MPSSTRSIELAYGRGSIVVQVPDENTQVIEPAFSPGLNDEHAAAIDALRRPIAAPPLAELLTRDTKVCVDFTDITRPTPNDRLIPWLLEELEGKVPRENIVLINALGTHRPNTTDELRRLLTPEVVENYRVVNHEAENLAALVEVGRTRTGRPR